MSDALFPGWQNPAAIVLLVTLRAGCNAILVAIAAGATGVRSTVTTVVAGLTVLCAVIVVSALRPGGLGLYASYVELLAQVALLGCAAYAVYSSPSPARLVSFAIVAICAAALLLFTIPVYGEAFVAP